MKLGSVAAIAMLTGVTGALVTMAVLDEMAVEPTPVATFATSRGVTGAPARIVAVPTTARRQVTTPGRRTTAARRETVGGVVRPGAWCAKADTGKYGKTADGTVMICSAEGEARPRWRAASTSAPRTVPAAPTSRPPKPVPPGDPTITETPTPTTEPPSPVPTTPLETAKSPVGTTPGTSPPVTPTT